MMQQQALNTSAAACWSSSGAGTSSSRSAVRQLLLQQQGLLILSAPSARATRLAWLEGQLWRRRQQPQKVPLAGVAMGVHVCCCADRLSGSVCCRTL